MRERAFNAKLHEVRAILAGTMTQVRRVALAPASVTGFRHFLDSTWDRMQGLVRGDSVGCPFGWAGDRLWVRETHLIVGGTDSKNPRVVYAATNDGPDAWLSPVWRPSIHMPRWASRITLEITSVRVERLQEISEADAAAEGVIRKSEHQAPWSGDGLRYWLTARDAFADLWQSINGPESWDANPWVWAISFNRVEHS